MFMAKVPMCISFLQTGTIEEQGEVCGWMEDSVMCLKFIRCCVQLARQLAKAEEEKVGAGTWTVSIASGCYHYSGVLGREAEGT